MRRRRSPCPRRRGVSEGGTKSPLALFTACARRRRPAPPRPFRRPEREDRTRRAGMCSARAIESVFPGPPAPPAAAKRCAEGAPHVPEGGFGRGDEVPPCLVYCLAENTSGSGRPWGYMKLVTTSRLSPHAK